MTPGPQARSEVRGSAQADQAEAAAVGRGGESGAAAAVVRHRDAEAAGAVAEVDADLGGVGRVAPHVGRCLLDDPGGGRMPLVREVVGDCGVAVQGGLPKGAGETFRQVGDGRQVSHGASAGLRTTQRGGPSRSAMNSGHSRITVSPAARRRLRVSC